MTIRGKAAIVGFGELPVRREYPGRSTLGLMSEASRLALEDASLTRNEIDGLIVDGKVTPQVVADYLGLHPSFSTGLHAGYGSNGVSAIAVAAAAIEAGFATTVLIAFGEARDLSAQGHELAGPPSVASEFEEPFGVAQGACSGYALCYQRHIHEFGTKPEQMALLAVKQRFNALTNLNAVFAGKPLTVEDVLSSRFVSEPLHLLECVMPAAGAAACIVTTPDRARTLPHRPVVVLGYGLSHAHTEIWETADITTTPTLHSAQRAFEMAGYRPADIEFAEFYDCFTILCAMSLEDAGFCKKGEVGAFIEETDLTYRGTFPVNTHGGILSCGQPSTTGGFMHVVEATRQIMGRAGERQVKRNNLAMVNGNGGTASLTGSLVLGSPETV